MGTLRLRTTSVMIESALTAGILKTSPLREGGNVRYSATVRRKNGANATISNFRATDIMEAAEVVRAKYGFDTDDPHKGFVIKEHQTLPTTTKESP